MNKSFCQLSSGLILLMIVLFPCSVFASNNMSNAQFKQFQENQKVFREFNDQMKAYDPPPLTNYELGNKFLNEGNYDEAIASFSLEIQSNPKNADAYNNRGRAYYFKGQYDIAIMDYNKAVEIYPKSAYFYNNRGLAYYSKGQYDIAIMDYNKAIELIPPHSNGWFGVFYEYNQSLDRQSADTYNNRGRAYYSKGQYDIAIMDYNKAIELSPKSADAYYNKALTCDELGRKPEAFQAYTLFIRYTSSNNPLIEKAKQRIRDFGGVI